MTEKKEYSRTTTILMEVIAVAVVAALAVTFIGVLWRFVWLGLFHG